MAKSKKTSKTVEEKTTTINKLPVNIKLPKVKFKLPEFKNLDKEKILGMFKNKKVIKIVAMILIIVSSFALIDLFVQYLNNDYSVAVVNGTRVPRSQYVSRLESAYGASAAEQLIQEEIIRQEAKNSGVTVSQEEIDAKVESIRTSIGGEEAFQQALETYLLTLDELEDQIRVDMMLTKIIEPTITYTEDDLKSYFESYSDTLFPDETDALEDGEKLDYDEYKDQVKEAYVEQSVSNESSTWLSEKTSEYRIQNNVTDKPKYGFLTTSVNIVKNLMDQINSNK